MSNSKITDILCFWFGETFQDEFPPRHVSDKWYGFHPTTDSFIKDHFQVDVEAGLMGSYDDWAQTSKGRLALIILLDQFTRHIYRNTPQAFSGDRKALALVHHPIHSSMATPLLLCEKMFYYGPLEHSEEFSDQQKHMAIYEEILKTTPQSICSKLEYYLYWFRVHYDVIARYSRFPWRNAILGRQSRAEEINYLKTAPDFGQNYQESVIK